VTDITTLTPNTEARQLEPGFGDYVRLLKPRVMSLVIFTALGAMAAAPSDVHPIEAFAALVCIAVGAGAAGALNMWYDADIDAEMGRTRARPVPTGVVEPGEALNLGIGLSILSVAMLGVFANWLAAGMLAFTIFFYAVIYTVLLKRATPQNIVIGGAAGAFPPVVAWAAVTGGMDLAPWLMFLVIFLWTPPHFWALALWKQSEYAKVSVPMMPVVAGPRATRRQIAIYAALLLPAAVAPAFTVAGGPVYLAVSLALSLRFLVGSIAVARRTEEEAAADRFRAEKKLFAQSILYLFALFGAFIADAAVMPLLGIDWPVWY